ncbi:MAG: hypothetical protein QOG99_1690 [Frankiales bacterium]|nr:hypothetical protein [Frankiales bacterium]
MPDAVVPLLATAVVLAVLLPVRRPPRNRLTIGDDALRLQLGVWDKLYCCRSDVVVAIADVEGVTVSPRRLVPVSGIRLPGTAIPGLMRAGSYGRGSARDFWNVRRADSLLVIQLRPGAAYRRLVLEVIDPTTTARDLRPALGAYTGALA